MHPATYPPVHPMRRQLLRASLAATLLPIGWPAPVLAQDESPWNAGLRQGQVRHRHAALPVVVFHPTRESAGVLDLGPYRLAVATRAAGLADRPCPVVFVSHGTGGSLLGHADLAIALARAGHVVVALEHLGDNYRDRSLVGHPAYAQERAAQLGAVVRAVLDEPSAHPWLAGLTIDSNRVAVFGHSAGGASAAALAGARLDTTRLRQHCEAPAVDDPMCRYRDPRRGVAPGLGGAPYDLAPDAPMPVRLHDPRVGAAVLAAPLTVPLAPESLRALPGRWQVWVPANDAVLAARHHLDPWRSAGPAVQLRIEPEAGHFSFITTVPPERRPMLGEAAEDPVGFDRGAFQRRLAGEVIAFLQGARDGSRG